MTVTRAAPHYLLSDAAPLSVRRTRAGDAWQPPPRPPRPPPCPAAAPPAAAPAGPAAAPVLLGMPAPSPSAR